jgi:hypothetical protein
MRTIIYLALLLTILTTSCKKDSLEPEIPRNNGVANFKEIKANDQFDWKTNSEYTMQVNGFKTLSPVTNTLKICSIDETEIYYQSLLAMDQSLKINFSIPIDTKEIIVKYGSINKRYSTVNKMIEFDFVINNPE